MCHLHLVCVSLIIKLIHYISMEGKCIYGTDNLTLEYESNLIDIEMATLPQIYLDEKELHSHAS